MPSDDVLTLLDSLSRASHGEIGAVRAATCLAVDLSEFQE
jgi:hypothetical protein